MLTSLRSRLAAAPAGASTSIPLDASRSRTRSLPRPRPELLGLLVLAAVLNLWGLSQNGWANEYYSAAVRSMTTSWHNFIFGAVVFFLTLGLTSGALAVLHGIDATPARPVELATLIAASTAATVTRYVALKTWVFATYSRSAISAAARAAPSASTGR